MPPPELRPVLLACLAAILWGLWWIPIRWLETLGLSGAVGATAMNAGALLAASIWLTVSGGTLRMPPRALLGAVLVGLAVTCYSAALNYSDVVRVILLFYLAPAWSKIIETAFLGIAWRHRSTVALVSAFAGAMLILGGDVSGGFRAGDALALVSGVFWSAGAALVFVTPGVRAVPLTAVTALSSVLAGIGFVGLSGVQAVPAAALGLGLGMGVVFVMPVLLLTLWSALRLAPATLTFLLTAEILSGVISAALLLDEPFGVLQALGAAAIILAAMVEVFPGLRARSG